MNAIDLSEINIDAINKLTKNMKKKSKSLPADMRKSLLKVIDKSPTLVQLKGKRLVLGVEFHRTLIRELNLNTNGSELDNNWHNFFRRLRKYGYIHPRSSHFPKKLELISINPNQPYLYNGNLAVVDSYVKAKSSLYKEYLAMELKAKIVLAYIDLRVYQSQRFRIDELEKLNVGDVIFTSLATAQVYIETHGVFQNIEVPPYQLIPIVGEELVSTLRECLDAGMKNPFKGLSKTRILSSYKKKFYGDVSMSEIYMASSNHNLRYSSPLQVMIHTTRKALSPLTIAELQVNKSIVIPKCLQELEGKRIASASAKASTANDEIDEEEKLYTKLESSFSLSEFDDLNELLKTKKVSEFLKKIPSAKRELFRYINDTDAEAHGILICNYVIFLLNRLDGKHKIRVSTFKNYFSLLNTHLFEKVEDVSSVQTHEVQDIISELSRNRYADKSIRKISALIRIFFAFHNQEHSTISMKLSSYPKSLVFDDELDVVLQAVEDKALRNADRVGSRVEYRVLRDKAIIVMARYTGMRKNEIRGRLLEDVYVYGNTLCVDVNPNGMRKLDMRLKTSTAKRRICTVIENIDHLNIVRQYLNIRENIKNENKFLFLDINRDYSIRSKPMRENVFDEFSEILKQVTGRYVSFHSLRHSFASYEVKKILANQGSNPYQLMDLSLKMGHESPETTLKVYTHRSVLEMGGV